MSDECNHKFEKIKYRNLDIIIEIDILMTHIMKDFWDHDIDTYQCCQENNIFDEDDEIDDEFDDEFLEDFDIEELNILNHCPNIIKNRAWVICQNKNREYIEKTYDVEIFENNHFGYAVGEYVEDYLTIDGFLFVIFNDLNKLKGISMIELNEFNKDEKDANIKISIDMFNKRCNFCTRKNRKIFEIFSTSPDRNMVVSICDICLIKIMSKLTIEPT